MPKDADQIISLMKELINEHRKIDPYYKNFSEYKGLEEYINETIADRNKLLLVAESGGRPIGYFIGIVEEAPYYSSEKKIGVVADTAVTSAKRRKGVLKMFFTEALEWFSKKGVKYIELSVDSRNKDAVTAWRSLGFEDYKIRLKRMV